MKMRYLLPLFYLLLGFSSCSEISNKIEDLHIDVSPEALNSIPEEGGTFTLKATSNFEGKLTVTYSNWIVLEDLETTSEGDLYTFKVDRNVSTNKREGEVVFTARGALRKIVVVQDNAPDLLNFTLDKDVVVLENQSETTIDIKVLSEAVHETFRVTSDSWISQVSKVALTGDETGWMYTFKIEENDKTGLRSGNITFVNPLNEEFPKSVAVTQPAEPSDGELDSNFKPSEPLNLLIINEAFASYASNKSADKRGADVQKLCDGNTTATGNYSGPWSKEAVIRDCPEIYAQYKSEFDKWPIPAGYLSKAYPLANGGGYFIFTLEDNNSSIDYMKLYPRSNDANGLWGKIDIWISTTESENDFVKVLNQYNCKYTKTQIGWIPLNKKKQLAGAKLVKVAVYDATGEYLAANEIEFYSAGK